MKVLGIDTTRKVAVLYVYDSDTGFEYSIKMSDKIKHSEGLFLYIEKALYECKMKITDFDAMAGVVGPGSFTGIRVGMSVLKGFSASTKAKLIPLTTFDMVANGFKRGVILLNSTASACYYGKFKQGNVYESGVIDKDKIMETFVNEKLFILKEEQLLINLEYNNIEVIDTLEKLFFDYLKIVINLEDCGDFLPFYLQLSQAERNIKDEK